MAVLIFEQKVSILFDRDDVAVKVGDSHGHRVRPFTDFDTKGVEGVFEHSDVVRLVQILRDIEPKFAARYEFCSTPPRSLLAG